MEWPIIKQIRPMIEKRAAQAAGFIGFDCAKRENITLLHYFPVYKIH